VDADTELLIAKGYPTLTTRELQVIRLVACGLVVKEIAAELALSPSYIRNIKYSINQKLGLEGSVTAILTRLAIERGLI
jgi:DNA-binding NarL/FixJ family response regulator